jgi:hypothetical protein
MSYGRLNHMGLILRPPTRTTGFRGMGYIYQPPAPRMSRASRLGRFRGMGDDSTDLSTLPLTPPSWSNVPLMPLGPAVSTGSDILNQMQQQAVVDQNPTDYVSPQSAIAAGLNPAAVNAAWAQGLAKYPTQQAAIAAGIAPTVITQLWQQSRAYSAAPATSSSFLTPTNLLIGGGLLFGLSLMMSGGKGRR